MMPASSRPPPAHSLPPLDDATSVPFSSLFDSKHFDLATVEATAQLADRSIFVMPNGRRFLFESISEPEDIQAQAAGSRPSPNQYLAQPQQQQQQQQPQYPQQSQYQYQQQPQPLSRASPVANSGPAQDLEALRRNSSSIRRRPVSNNSSSPYLPGGGRNLSPGGPAPGAEPKAATHEVTTMMANMDIQQTPRFGAVPLFGHSDGGVQAAEALIDPYVGPRDEPSPGRPYSANSLPAQSHTQNLSSAVRQSYSSGPPNTSHVTQIHSFNYPNYMAQAYQAQEAQRQASASPSRPQYESLMEHSTPMPTMTVTSEQYFASWGPSPISPEKEISEAQVLMNGGGSSASVNTSTSNTREYPPPPPSAGSEQANSLSLSYQSRQPSYVNAGRSYPYAPNGFDTQTPIVVVQERHPSSTSTMDSRSTGRDNVMPGEDILYDGPVKSSNTLSSPVFVDGQLKVFRNSLNNDLRFHCKVGNDSETYWMKSTDAQLVPVYAYDPRFPNVVYIRDKTDASKSTQPPTTTQGTTGRPSGIYQFNRLKELCDFQAKLTTEKVVLDIASVKLVRLCKAHSRSYETYSSIRLQVWHEAELRRDGGKQSDAVSFKTAGTALSGPLRERLVASSSRLVIYLGRLGEYINVFITDDYEARAEGSTMVKLKPRKSGVLGKKGSRWPGIKAHIEEKGQFEMAGLDIHGQAPNVDVESRYELYKTFEIDFENSPSQDNFMRKWEEVMRERRSQRVRLNQIQEEMEQAVFSGKKARELW